MTDLQYFMILFLGLSFLGFIQAVRLCVIGAALSRGVAWICRGIVVAWPTCFVYLATTYVQVLP